MFKRTKKGSFPWVIDSKYISDDGVEKKASFTLYFKRYKATEFTELLSDYEKKARELENDGIKTIAMSMKFIESIVMGLSLIHISEPTRPY